MRKRAVGVAMLLRCSDWDYLLCRRADKYVLIDQAGYIAHAIPQNKLSKQANVTTTERRVIRWILACSGRIMWFPIVANLFEALFHSIYLNNSMHFSNLSRENCCFWPFKVLPDLGTWPLTNNLFTSNNGEELADSFRQFHVVHVTVQAQWGMASLPPKTRKM